MQSTCLVGIAGKASSTAVTRAISILIAITEGYLPGEMSSRRCLAVQSFTDSQERSNDYIEVDVFYNAYHQKGSDEE